MIHNTTLPGKLGYVEVEVNGERKYRNAVTGVLLEDETYEPSLEELRRDKLAELSAACREAITAGCDATLTSGVTEHYALEETDQINLSTALAAVEQGAEGYPYHADGQLCRVYPAADILAVAQAATEHKLYHTTYCNHLMAWARRAETAEELAEITYGAQLPADLAANMDLVLGNV